MVKYYYLTLVFIKWNQYVDTHTHAHTNILPKGNSLCILEFFFCYISKSVSQIIFFRNSIIIIPMHSMIVRKISNINRNNQI